MATQKLTLAEISAVYRKTPKTFRKYVRELGIPHERIGPSMLFDPHVVAAHLLVTEQPEPSNVRTFPVRKPTRNGKAKVITSKRFAEVV